MKQNMLARVLWAVFAVSLIGVGIWLWRVYHPGTPPLPVVAVVPEFAFTERSGEQVSLTHLRGHVWVADFIFTRCAGTCPVMTTRMSELQDVLAREDLAEEVRLVSFSVDPEYDTPEVLARYADGYGASREHWYFLTGAAGEVQTLANKGFLLAAMSGGSAEEPIIHSNRFVLVDQQGRIRAYYLGTELGVAEEVLRDVKLLLAEAAS